MSSTGAAVACSASGEFIVGMRGLLPGVDPTLAFLRQHFGVLAQ